MKQYLDLCRDVLENGHLHEARTAERRLSVFGRQLRFDLSKGFPLLTTKKLHWPSIVHELLWFISGSTNNNWLERRGVRIWREWAKPNGELGPIYGWQWRHAGVKANVDQLQNAIDLIMNDPHSSRIIVDCWQVDSLPYMALPPCHYTFQFNVINGKLNLMFNMRSCDIFLGNPFNIASYALLLSMVATVTGLEAGELVATLGDAHIYENHIEQVKEQLTREPRPLPTLLINPAFNGVGSVDSFDIEDFIIEGYDPHPHIAGKVAV